MIGGGLWAWLACAAPAASPGHLVLAGGGPLPDEVYQRFIALAGGPQARILVIPTAANNPLGRDRRKPFLQQGAENVAILHAETPQQASGPGFVEQISQADAVWFTGGRQWRIIDAYLNTPAEEALDTLLQRGGVIGGTSAGASAQASLLVRGDTRSNTILLGDHQEGFGWLPGVAVDQHLLVRGRLQDMLSVLAVHPDVLGIGLDEGAALVVTDSRAEVIGRSVVVFYDAHIPAPYIKLGPGSVYNLDDRKVLREVPPPPER